MVPFVLLLNDDDDDDDDDDDVSAPFLVFSLITREEEEDEDDDDGRYADAGFLHGLLPCLSKTPKESSSETIISWTIISRVNVASDKRRVVFKNSYNPAEIEEKTTSNEKNVMMLCSVHDECNADRTMGYNIP